MRKLFIFLIILFSIAPGISQKHDYVWLMGQNHQSIIEHSGTVIDFNATPPDIYYEFRDMFFRQVNASICDTAGNLLFYTNGIYIANALNEPMENGDGLNPGPHADANQNYGYIVEQGAMILPLPEQENLHYLLHIDNNAPTGILVFHTRHFYYTIVDMSAENGLGAVVEKNRVLLEDILDMGKLTATKHANGRDWWILVRKYNSNQYYRALLNPEGIHVAGLQPVGNPLSSNSIGQAVFSPDGSKFANLHLTGYAGDPIYVSIFDFDRCIGELSNPVQFTYADTAWCGGVAISPNSRFLYVSSFKYLYQYDLWAGDIESSRITVAEWDGFVENGSFATTFYLAQLAPDGRIYINSNNGVSYLHVINHPDSLGLACDVCQHCVDLPSINSFSLPNFPNYRLGHLEGSPCDTLRQPPTAAWRHEAWGLQAAFTDESFHDIRAWHWTFGDGAADTVAHPVHAYAAEGVYEVCLTVSNPRGSDTLCREVAVVMNDAREEAAQGLTVSILPNPASARVVVNAEGLAAPAGFVLYDTPGRELLRLPLLPVNGRASVEASLQGLPAGVYFYTVESGGRVVWRGKIMKE
jgi:hypothetical protein